jgi:hypothetical protein
MVAVSGLDVVYRSRASCNSLMAYRSALLLADLTGYLTHITQMTLC